MTAMKIHLNRGGQSLGQFTPEEVRSGYLEGKFTGSDLAWRDGMEIWRPLAEVIDEIAPATSEQNEAKPPAVHHGPAWERRAESGFIAALLETIRTILLEPGKSFASMRQTGGLGAPLFFYVIVGTICGLVGVFYQVVFTSMQSAESVPENAVAAFVGTTLGIGLVIMLLPIFLVAAAFVSSSITHLALMIVGGARRPFEATFRVVCYANGSTSVLQLLPVCGGILASVWGLVLMIIGLSRVHGIGKGRAAVAVLLPMIICCGLLIAGVFAAVAAAGGMAALMESAGKP
jgi:hypothetical protein